MLRQLSELYNGFYIRDAISNNIFSYPQRKNKRIFVPPLVEGTPSDLALGTEIAFSEIEDGQEINKCGLEHMIYMNGAGKMFFIFDNHNHAFCFWIAAYRAGWLEAGQMLVHVDQHSDLREPEAYLDVPDLDSLDLRRAFEYTNSCLNVGNFIKPALALNLFSKVEIIDSSTAFEKSFQREVVLDIDMDIFSDDMAYIPFDDKMQRIQEHIESAKVITIATSPYFMDQLRAIDIVKRMLRPWI